MSAPDRSPSVPEPVTDAAADASAAAPTRVRVLTLGCRLNTAESEETIRALRAQGIDATAAADGEGPDGGIGADDVIVVNTCTVTSDASRSSRKLIRRAAATGARVVVTGCYAVAAPEVCADEPGVVDVVANKDKDSLAQTVAALGGVTTIPVSAIGRRDLNVLRSAFKVQTGCDEGCTFCIIPTTRGGLESRDADDVIAGIRAQVASGIREVALTGVHLGKFGLDAGGDDSAFPALVRRILAEVPELGWLRLSSIEANRVSDELLGVMASDPRVCAHLHVPLQAGHDRVLAEMGRPYDTAVFADAVARIRATLGPQAGLTTDVMVGFPGETDETAAATRAFVEACAFTKLHVFRFSPRPDTPAAARTDQVPEDTKKAWAAELRRTGERLSDAFHTSLVGSELAVMLESAHAAGAPGADGVVRPELRATATNYVKVTTAGPAGLVGRIVPARVRAASAAGVTAELDLAALATDASVG